MRSPYRGDFLGSRVVGGIVRSFGRLAFFASFLGRCQKWRKKQEKLYIQHDRIEFLLTLIDSLLTEIHNVYEIDHYIFYQPIYIYTHMKKLTFQLKTNYIQLNNLLKVLGVSDTWWDAKHMIIQWLVSVNGDVEERIRRKIKTWDIVTTKDTEITVLATAG